MKWVNFVVIVQGVLVLLFIVLYIFQWSVNEYHSNPYENSSSSNGYLPTKDPFDLSRFSKAALILVTISILELVVISRTIK